MADVLANVLANVYNVPNCVVCDVTPVTQCSKLNGCLVACEVCMECAMRIGTHEGGPRCPVCRRHFDTITQTDGRYSVNLQTNTLYRMGVPYLVMSAQEMKIASVIVVGEDDESGTMSLNLYMPKFLKDVTEATGWNLVVTNADDMPIERAVTRSITSVDSYVKDKYRDEVQIAVAKLLDLMETHDVPLFFFKAVTSSFFTKMVTIGKYETQPQRSHPEDDTEEVEHILCMPFPPAFLAILDTMGIMG